MTSRVTKYWDSGSIPLIGPDMLGDIISSLADLAVVVSERGTIISILSSPGPNSFSHWEHRDFRELLTVESVPKFERQLAIFLHDPEQSTPFELNHTDVAAGWEMPVSYAFHRIGPDGALLMLGRDLRPISDLQKQLVRAQIALERDYEAQREYETRFRVLLESTRDAMLFVTIGTGRISSLNAQAATILGGRSEELMSATFANLVETPDDLDPIKALSAAARVETARPVSMRLRHSNAPLQVTPRLFRASGERMILCILETAPEAGVCMGDLAAGLAGLYDQGPDGIVFTDPRGEILATNEAFLNISDVAEGSTLRGQSLVNYLQRGTVDLNLLLENATHSGSMRLYSSGITGAFGGTKPVEMSATYLEHPSHPAIAFVIRNVNRAGTGMSAQLPDEDGQSVRSLIGSSSLRDIVAQTSDVVEKLCVEVALELTRNNKLAAAEMLGLSRQSLYVKLRKHDIGGPPDSA